MEGKDIILVAGGTGISPVRSLALRLIENRKRYGEIYLLYGARTPSDLMYRSEYRSLGKHLNLCLTVDQPSRDWKGKQGLVTTLCKDIRVDPRNSVGVAVGPEIMYDPLYGELSKLEITKDRMIVSLERRMTCGFGRCQRCTIGTKYVCMDGPVFTYEDYLRERKSKND